MDVFVYGTLRDPDLREAVLGVTRADLPAMLRGYAVRPVADDVVPMIVPETDAVTPGLLIGGLTTAEADRLALYEGAFGYTPATVTVALSDGRDVEAMMWRPPTDLEPGQGSWSLHDWQSRCGRTAVLAAREVFAHSDRPAPSDLGRIFPMAQKRAWNRFAAETTTPVATVRRVARTGDVAVTDPAPPLGRFFRLQGFDVTHRRFDGGTQGPLPREVFVGVDAVLVLPYDAVRQRIVMVEQVRMGPITRGDPNPWVLEPVAGMIDAFETPDTAALRETREEAGLDVTLRHVASYYPSPGNATDFFHTYIGLCDLPDLDRYAGGLEAEQEDLRLHVLTLDHALTLVDSGEIGAGPGIGLIWWLALHRDALRLEFAPGGA